MLSATSHGYRQRFVRVALYRSRSGCARRVGNERGAALMAVLWSCRGAGRGVVAWVLGILRLVN